jgi:hypothetical protein
VVVQWTLDPYAEVRILVPQSRHLSRLTQMSEPFFYLILSAGTFSLLRDKAVCVKLNLQFVQVWVTEDL